MNFIYDLGITQMPTMPNTSDESISESTNTSITIPAQMVEYPEPTKSSSSEQYLGELISGTYCSRIFHNCDRKKCRLQSPNFPGLYPRNLTCYYAVSHSAKNTNRYEYHTQDCKIDTIIENANTKILEKHF